MRFTPDQDGEALVRRRIRAAELLFLAGDVCRSLEHLEVLELWDLTTADLERALPLLLDMTELVHGAAAATAIVVRAVDGAGPDPRRRALVLALASDVVYGLRDARRELAAEAVRNAEAAGPAADASLHRALINLLMANVSAGDGLDRALLDRAPSTSRPGCLSPACTTPPTCSEGCGPSLRKTSRRRGRRCTGASSGPGMRGMILRWPRSRLPGGGRGTGGRLYRRRRGARGRGRGCCLA